MFNFYTLSKFVKRFAPIILVVVVFSGLFLASVGNAHALFPSAREIATSIGLFFLEIILTIVQFFTGVIGQLFSALVDKITLAGFSNMEVVKTGWTITRDLVNMFFILGIVIIAFATILKIETYNIKALLPKLIIMALLINFSFVISGVIIDASNVTFSFFRNSIENEDIGQAIISATGADKAGFGSVIESTNDEGLITVTSQSLTQTQKIASYAFSIVMIGLTGFVLLNGLVLLFTRVVALWVLIIFAPIAWFFSIFPATQSKAKEWWTQLLGWSFFAPIYMFFIYLSLLLANELQNPQYSGLFKATATVLVPNSLTGLLNNLFGYTVIIVILYLATKVAKTLGLAGADASVKFASNIAKKGLGATLGVTKGAGKWAGKAAGRKIREAGAPRLEKLSNKLASSKFAQSSKFGGIGGWMASKALKGPSKLIEGQRKAVAEAEKGMEHQSADMIKNRFAGLSATGKVAAARVLAEKKGGLKAGGSLTEKRIDGVVDLAKRHGLEGPLVKSRLDLAIPKNLRNAKSVEDIKEKRGFAKKAVEKIKSKDIDKIQEKSFDDEIIIEEMLKTFKPTHLSTMATSNTKGMNKIQTFIDGLGDDRKEREEAFIKISAKNQALATYINGVTGQSAGWTFGKEGKDKEDPQVEQMKKNLDIK